MPVTAVAALPAAVAQRRAAPWIAVSAFVLALLGGCTTGGGSSISDAGPVRDPGPGGIGPVTAANTDSVATSDPGSSLQGPVERSSGGATASSRRTLTIGDSDPRSTATTSRTMRGGSRSAATLAAGGQRDVERFDIDGVLLGMSPDEVVATLSTRFGVARDKLVISQNGTSEHWRSKYPYTDSISYEQAGHAVRVNFDVFPPFDSKRPIQASRISLQLGSGADSAAALRQTAIEKFGEPANTRPTTPPVLEWCANPSRAGSDGAVCTQAERGATLTLTGSRLLLEDPRATPPVAAGAAAGAPAGPTGQGTAPR